MFKQRRAVQPKFGVRNLLHNIHLLRGTHACNSHLDHEPVYMPREVSRPPLYNYSPFVAFASRRIDKAFMMPSSMSRSLAHRWVFFAARLADPLRWI